MTKNFCEVIKKHVVIKKHITINMDVIFLFNKKIFDLPLFDVLAYYF